jgi:DNA-binding SARP family transcriptional activator/tetratricopeptide (TPR) repeat protein
MVRVRLLGIPAVFDGDGKEVRLRSKKQLGVFVYLVVDGRDRPVSRDALMEAFWAEAPRARAYHSLCQAVTHIRAAFGPDAVRRRGEALQLLLPVQTDIETLATEHERGDFTHPLREAEWWGGVEFGHWVERSRERCRRLAEAALREGITFHRRAGATLRVHRCAELLYQLDPLSEPAVLALAERELLQGDVVGAIRLLRLHLARVAERLGCQPQPAPERLLRRLEAGAHPPVELVPKRLAAHAARVRPTVLVARERELSHLEGEWQRVHDDRALRSCLFTGPAGIGKSSLIRRFAATVAARAQTAFVVSCQEMGAGIPFAALADLVAALLRDPSVSGTDPLWLAEVSRIQPAVRQQYPGVPPTPEAPPETVRVRIAEGVTRMIAAITDGAPLAVLFDDLHYLDPATRDVLAVLCRRAQHLPLLLVGTARSVGIETGLSSGPVGRESVAWTSSQRLEPLTGEGTRALLAVLAPALAAEAPEVVLRIVDLADGNPQFAEMLLADWQQYATASLAAGRAADELPADWRPPESLRHAFAKLYEGLDLTSQQLLHVLAVAQRALTPEEVGEVFGKGPGELDKTTLGLLTLGILRLDQGALTFKNEIHRAFAYFAMNSETQKYYHRMLARAIHKIAASKGGFRTGLEVGRHSIRSGDLHAGGSQLRTAARLAISAGAFGEAEKGLLELLRHEDQSASTATKLILASAQLGGNKPRECLATLSTFPPPTTSSHEGMEFELLSLRAASMLRETPAETLGPLLHDTMTRSLAAGHLDVAIPTLQLCAELAAECGRTDQLESLRGECEATLRAQASPEEFAGTRLTLGYTSLVLGQFARAREEFHDGIRRLVRESRSGPLYQRLLNGLGLSEMGCGRYREAEAAFLRLEESVNAQSVLPSPLLWSNIAVFWQEMGRLHRASDYFSRALRSLQDHPDPKACATVLSTAASLAVDIGEFALAESCLALAQDMLSRSLITTDQVDTWLVAADFHLATQENELAWKLMRERVIPLAVDRTAIGESARHERLLRHYAWITGGLADYSEACDSRSVCVARLPYHGRAELACFHEWLMPSEGSNTRSELECAVAAGLGGVVLHLAAIGTVRLDMPRTTEPPPTRDQVVSAFPRLFSEGLPSRLDWELPDLG